MDNNSTASFAHTLSSFLVDAYVSIICEEFDKRFSHFCHSNNIVSRDDFKKVYTSIKESEIIDLMSLDKTPLKKADDQLGKMLKNSILDSYEVQKMDGKGAFVVRKLLRAYVSNPQQLPDEYISRFIRIELRRHLPDDVFTNFISTVGNDNMSISHDVNTWQVYECRQALRVIKSDQYLSNITYSILLRIVFDYVAGMTDTFALKQYRELY